MKISYFFFVFAVLSLSSSAQHQRDLRMGYNLTLLSNNTFDKPTEFVKGKLSMGQGLSLLYRQSFKDKLGWRVGLTYSKHAKSFSINYPLSNFDTNYNSTAGSFQDNWSIKGIYQNADLSIGLFYKKDIQAFQLSLSTDLVFDYSTFWQTRVDYNASYARAPNPLFVGTATIVSAYGEPGIKQAGGYLIEMIPKYRLSASLNYSIYKRLGVFTSVGYEKIIPNIITSNGATEGFYPIDFLFYKTNGEVVENTRFVDKFNFVRIQIGLSYNLSFENQDNKRLYHKY